MFKKVTLLGLFALIASIPLMAGTMMVKSSDGMSGCDTTIIFRFVPGREMFYSPYLGNETAIALTKRLIDRHREALIQGRAHLHIHGFCGSFGSRRVNLKAAKNRSNQVKSWFITNYGMKEDYYLTRNSTHDYNGMGDIVALVSIRYVAGQDSVGQRRQTDSLARERSLAIEAERRKREAERSQADSLAREDSLRQACVEALRHRQADSLASLPVKIYEPTPWYVKTNLLYDAALMPSLEVEYRFNDRWSAAVEGNIAWWHNNGKHKYYQLATIFPELRYWIKPQCSRRGHYLGLFGGGGWYDLENGGKGYKGEGGLIGVSYGYMFPVGKYFAFEAGVGVGFMTTEYEEYLPIDGHYVYQQTNRFNYFGPVKLKFAFVWNIGRWMEKKGGNP